MQQIAITIENGRIHYRSSTGETGSRPIDHETKDMTIGRILQTLNAEPGGYELAVTYADHYSRRKEND